MVRIVNSLVRWVMAPALRGKAAADIDQSLEHGDAQVAVDDYVWVNARGKTIGSKRSRTKRLERRTARELREAQQAVKVIRRTARN